MRATLSYNRAILSHAGATSSYTGATLLPGGAAAGQKKLNRGRNFGERPEKNRFENSKIQIEKKICTNSFFFGLEMRRKKPISKEKLRVFSR